MTSAPPGSDPARSTELVPPEHDDARLAAEELFVHGLLGVLHEPGADEQRTDRAMRAIRAEMFRERAPRRRLRQLAGVVVSLVAITGAMLFLLPRQGVAYARVQASIEAARLAGNLRYEIRSLFRPDNDAGAEARGTMDSSGDGRFYLQTRGPLGNIAQFGRDAQGEWAIRRDGTIERERPRAAWPRWAFVNNEPILAESVDQLLNALATGYTLRVNGTRAPDGTPGEQCDLIVGERKEQTSPRHAPHVELLINRTTMLVERIEMQWPDPALPPDSRPQGASPRLPEISRLLLIRVESPDVREGWYSPEAHIEQ